MLGKLLKYEWKATGKVLLLLNLYIVLLTVAGKIMSAANVFETDSQVIRFVLSLLLAGYIISIIAVSIAATLFLMSRFYKNLYTDEGYLMHTLPVKPWMLVLSKFIYAFIAFLITGCIITGSIFCIIMTPDMWSDAISQLPLLIKETSELFRMSFAGIVFFCILLFVLSYSRSILMFYASISLGQLMKNHRIIGALLFYGGLYTVSQIAVTIFMIIFGFASANLDSVNAVYNYARTMFWFAGIEALVSAVIYWFLTVYMTSRKLNLE